MILSQKNQKSKTKKQKNYSKIDFVKEQEEDY